MEAMIYNHSYFGDKFIGSMKPTTYVEVSWYKVGGLEGRGLSC